ncbi:MAG: bestrophin family ion channel [Armatimonas sp.]
MHAGRSYSLQEIVRWTRFETVTFTALAVVPTALHVYLGLKFLVLSWPPIALLGTAVAFVTGFRNNASYARLWEARQIWGSILNTSRTFGIQIVDFLPPEEPLSTRTRIIHRHIAWLTLLRYQLRQCRIWETMKLPENVEYHEVNHLNVAEWQGDLKTQLEPLLSQAERDALLKRRSPAVAALAHQSEDISALWRAGKLTELCYLEIERTIALLIDLQGRCERIKNFPYPRQYATLNRIFIWLFIALLPLGLIQEFDKLGGNSVWFAVPVSVVISWVLHTMDKIGSASENPFEGTANDVPITALSRTAEIDLRDMLTEDPLPDALTPTNNILL